MIPIINEYSIKLVYRMIGQAIEGNLKQKDFYEQWPDELEGLDVFDMIFSDIESAIEHFPGRWFVQESNHEQWHKMPEYFILLIDQLVLEKTTKPIEIIACRDFVLQGKPLSREIIRKRIDDFFK
ncbi:hypothetical protein K1X84_10010 [bacterium]|nr:hypothetical protein [bacterium]